MNGKISNNNVVALANAILGSCAERDIYLTPLKLQKLLYIAYVEYLEMGGEDLGIPFALGSYGPVNEELYFALKKWGRKNIEKYVKSENGSVYSWSDEDFINSIVNRYGYYTEPALVLSAREKFEETEFLPDEEIISVSSLQKMGNINRSPTAHTSFE